MSCDVWVSLGLIVASLFDLLEVSAHSPPSTRTEHFRQKAEGFAPRPAARGGLPRVAMVLQFLVLCVWPLRLSLSLWIFLESAQLW